MMLAARCARKATAAAAGAPQPLHRAPLWCVCRTAAHNTHIDAPAIDRRYHSSASRRSLGGTAEPLRRCSDETRAMVSNRPATASASSPTSGLPDSRSSCAKAVLLIQPPMSSIPSAQPCQACRQTPSRRCGCPPVPATPRWSLCRSMIPRLRILSTRTRRRCDLLHCVAVELQASEVRQLLYGGSDLCPVAEVVVVQVEHAQPGQRCSQHAML